MEARPRRRPIDAVDVRSVAEALDDGDRDTRWWYDLATGQVEPGSPTRWPPSSATMTSRRTVAWCSSSRTELAPRMTTWPPTHRRSATVAPPISSNGHWRVAGQRCSGAGDQGRRCLERARIGRTRHGPAARGHRAGWAMGRRRGRRERRSRHEVVARWRAVGDDHPGVTDSPSPPQADPVCGPRTARSAAHQQYERRHISEPICPLVSVGVRCVPLVTRRSDASAKWPLRRCITRM